MSIEIKKPTLLHAAVTFLTVTVIIGVGLFKLSINLHSLLLICLLTTTISALFLSNEGFKSIRKAMNNGIERALSAIYIFILIGVLIASFIQSGTVGALIYYGLDIISPSFFLPAGLILCSFMSIATGSSWSTVGTAGVVLIGIGGVMGIPLPIVAGMVASGACFGDKMSPVSDTTNLAAMSSEVDLYDHIKSMMYTTIPTYIITLVIFTFIGLKFASTPLPTGAISSMSEAIKGLYTINVITLLPLVVMVGLSYKKVSAEVAMFISALVAVLIAVFMQGTDLVSVLNSLYNGGGKTNTGIDSLDTLFSRGGIGSMAWTLSLALLALALGGMLNSFGFLPVIIEALIKKIKTAGALVATTIIACFVGNMSLGEAYMSIILGGQLFGKAFDQQKIDRTVLSRSVEEGATLTTAIIPWTTGGAFFSATLGVDVLDFAPWAILNWMNPILAIVFAIFGIALFRIKKSDRKS